MKQVNYRQFVLFCALWAGLSVPVMAQKHLPHVDMHAYSFHKYFYDANYPLERVWDLKEHDCPSNPPKEFLKLFADIEKRSQSHLDAMVKGGVMLSTQQLVALDKALINAIKGYPEAVRDVITSCILGYKCAPYLYNSTNLDYYDMILQQIRFLRRIEDYSHLRYGRPYQFKLLRNSDDVQLAWENTIVLGAALQLSGMHTLTQSNYLLPNYVETTAAKRTLMQNIDRFKGVRPVIENSDEYLDVPIFSIQPAWFFANGLVGTINRSDKFRHRMFQPESPAINGISALGQQAITRLVDNTQGHRILIDVSGMAVNARKWYYQFLNDHHYAHTKDTIPVIASNVVISGISWDDANYISAEKALQSNDYLMHNHAALAYEDLQAVYKTRGLIGISLNKNLLISNTKVNEKIEGIVQGGRTYREYAIQAVALNICRIIERISDPMAWDLISIGSSHDFTVPLKSYKSSSDFHAFRADLLAFFKNPTNLFGIYSAEQVRAFYYHYTPEELVDKIMGKNAYHFMLRHYTNLERHAKHYESVRKN